MTNQQIGGMTKQAIERAMKEARREDRTLQPAQGWDKTLEQVIGVKLFYLSWEARMTSYGRKGYVALVVDPADRSRTPFKLLVDSIPCTEAIDLHVDGEPFFATCHERTSANGRRYFTFRADKMPQANRKQTGRGGR